MKNYELRSGADEMGKQAKDVTIKLNTTIDDQGEMEYNTVKESGQFYRKGNVDVLIYEEEIEEGAIIRNLITIKQDKINIKRTGPIKMNQQFQLNQKTESHYQHPHGQLHMETHTNSVTYQSSPTDCQGRLVISYTVKLNGMDERKHLLELIYN